jgi:hypothetical protein
MSRSLGGASCAALPVKDVFGGSQPWRVRRTRSQCSLILHFQDRSHRLTQMRTDKLQSGFSGWSFGQSVLQSCKSLFFRQENGRKRTQGTRRQLLRSLCSLRSLAAIPCGCGASRVGFICVNLWLNVFHNQASSKRVKASHSDYLEKGHKTCELLVPFYPCPSVSIRGWNPGQSIFLGGKMPVALSVPIDSRRFRLKKQIKTAPIYLLITNHQQLANASSC